MLIKIVEFCDKKYLTSVDKINYICYHKYIIFSLNKFFNLKKPQKQRIKEKTEEFSRTTISLP